MIDRRGLILLAGCGILEVSSAHDARAGARPKRLDQPGMVIAIRHAIAPGNGDPPSFVLDDCTTQRNLDASGRTQARAIGDGLRAAGLGAAQVYSSRWCRCLETAELLGLGPVSPLPALDSFFGEPALRGPRTTALYEFLAQEGANGPPLVLVTHQVNITAIAGRGTRSGEGVVLDRGPGGKLTVRASLPPPPI